jgi:hybrid polyketide synthase/nonribosomal peptide synthetase ACE1
MALEAAASLANDSTVKLVEILDFKNGRPLTFDNENSNVETLFTLSNIASQPTKEIVRADFTCYTSRNDESESLVLAASGRVQVLLGEQSALTLPLQPSPSSGMHHVHSNTFYDFLMERGYQYSGPFRAISSLKRRLNAATGLLPNCFRADSSNLSLHPATLESAFQAAILAYCAPGDVDLWSIHVPAHIRRISVNPSLCGDQVGADAQLPFTCQLDISTKNSIKGDVIIFADDKTHTWVQLEGLSLVPSSFASPLEDRILFAQTLWNVATPNAQKALDSSIPEDLIQACDQVAYYYLQKLDAMTIPENMDVSLSPEHRQLLQYAEEAVTLNSKGKHPFAKRQWINDTETQILDILSQYPKSPHLKFLRAAGEALPAAIFGGSKIHNLARSNSWSKSPWKPLYQQCMSTLLLPWPARLHTDTVT